VEVVRSVDEVRRRRRSSRSRDQRVGLVPTMGFLHEGHLSLVRRAHELADEVWVSIFVNPTQFGLHEDLERYPRDLDRDLALLEGERTDVVFAPPVEEMYPRPAGVRVSFPGLDDVLEGACRPGHFAGVGLVVAKLLHLAEPEVAVFGQKDAQQAVLIRRMVEDLDFPVRVEVAPTLREPDGLAMSSRNVYLSAEERSAAPALYRGLTRAAAAVADGERDPARVEALLAETVASEARLELEYARCVDRETLATPGEISGPVLIVVAARAGRTRLIDNIPVTPGDAGRR